MSAGAEMYVRRGQYVPAHARWEQSSGEVLNLANGDRFGYLTRTFSCACGHQLLDGDRVYDTDNGPVHVNCYQEST